MTEPIVGETGLKVAANVARLRYARGLSTTGMSRALKQIGCHIASTGITRIEKGQRRVDVDDLVPIAQVLRVQPGDLLVEPGPICPTCNNEPPAGYACNLCGISGEIPDGMSRFTAAYQHLKIGNDLGE